MPTRLNSQVTPSPPFGRLNVPLIGIVVADLPAEAGPPGSAPDDEALPVAEPRLHLIRRQLELRVSLHVRLGIDRELERRCSTDLW